MSDFFNELIDPFAKDTPKPEKKKNYKRQLVGRETIMAVVTLTDFRNPKLIGAHLEGNTVHLTIEQDELVEWIEDPLHD